MIRNIGAYLHDRWNVLDGLSVGILCAGFFYRLVDSSSSWGRALYALSTPFVFSRLLFYAQFLPFQGSMVEVSFQYPPNARRGFQYKRNVGELPRLINIVHSNTGRDPIFPT